MIREPYTIGNSVLDALPAADRASNEADVEVVILSAHQTTRSAGAALAFVDFPIDAVLSLVATLVNGDSIEVAIVGRESFVGPEAVLDGEVALRSAFCQVRGRVARMARVRFDERMGESASFSRLIRGNVRATLFATQQYVACNVKHAIPQRCARWLAMTADRVGRSEFVLTHDFLAIMLGVSWGAVAESAQELERIGAISYHRGVLTVIDKRLLDDAACECYTKCRDAYRAALVG